MGIDKWAVMSPPQVQLGLNFNNGGNQIVHHLET